MKTGIITKGGKFISCLAWQHISTAERHQTEQDFLLCRRDTVGIVGDLNRKQFEGLITHCIDEDTRLEDVVSSDLEDAIKSHT